MQPPAVLISTLSQLLSFSCQRLFLHTMFLTYSSHLCLENICYRKYNGTNTYKEDDFNELLDITGKQSTKV